MIQETVKATGALQIKLYGPDGKLKQEQNVKNLVVTTGKGYIASRMVSTPTAMSHMAIGSGTVDPAVGDTTLGSELGRVSLTSSTAVAAVVTYIASFGAGTGTGAIALAVASQRPQAKITAVDFSLEALTVAQENAETLQLANVRFIQSHWFDGLTNDMFDFIVSNPPYIAKDDVHLQQGDLRFEPVSALASGVDGLDDIRVIVANAPKYLNENAWLMLEHGYDQAAAVATLMANAGFKNIRHVNDLAGIERVTMGCWSLGS